MNCFRGNQWRLQTGKILHHGRRWKFRRWLKPSITVVHWMSFPHRSKRTAQKWFRLSRTYQSKHSCKLGVVSSTVSIRTIAHLAVCCEHWPLQWRKSCNGIAGFHRDQPSRGSCLVRGSRNNLEKNVQKSLQTDLSLPQPFLSLSCPLFRLKKVI